MSTACSVWGRAATRVGLQWLHYVETQVSVWKVRSGLMWAVRGHWAGGLCSMVDCC